MLCRDLSWCGCRVTGPVEDMEPPRPDLDETPSDADRERFGDHTMVCGRCGTELNDIVTSCWTCGMDVSYASPRWAFGAALGEVLWRSRLVAILVTMMLGYLICQLTVCQPEFEVVRLLKDADASRHLPSGHE
jgi:hypothetical protein